MVSTIWLNSAQSGNLPRMKSMQKTLKHLDINSVTKLNQSALMLAIRGNHNNVIDYLLEIGCDTSIEDNYGENALSLAIRYKNLNLYDKLVSQGATLSFKLSQNMDECLERALEILKQKKESLRKIAYLVLINAKYRIKFLV